MKRWLHAWLPALAWAAVIFALSSVPGDDLPEVSAPNADKLVHALVYVALGLLCMRGVRATFSLAPARAILAATLLATLYGVTDEIHQAFTPLRSPDWRDGIADAAGGFVGALVMAKLAARRARATST